MTAETKIANTPPQRRARRVRVPRGGKGASSPALVVAWSASGTSRPVPSSASLVSGKLGVLSLEVAVPGWVSG